MVTRLLAIVSVVSFRAAFVNSDSTSKLAMAVGCWKLRDVVSLAKVVKFSVVY